MKSIFTLLILSVLASHVYAQNIGINSNGSTPDNSAMLDVSSTSKGFLAPRMNTGQMTGISSPATGLTVYNTDSGSYCIYNGSAWLKVLVTPDNKWSANGSSIYNNNGGNVGVGTTTPNSTLQVNGSMSMGVSFQSGSGAVTLDNSAVVWYFTGAGSGASAVLPSASSCAGRMYMVTNYNGIGTALPISSYIFQGGPYSLVPNAHTVILISNGTDWYSLGLFN